MVNGFHFPDWMDFLFAFYLFWLSFQLFLPVYGLYNWVWSFQSTNLSVSSAQFASLTTLTIHSKTVFEDFRAFAYEILFLAHPLISLLLTYCCGFSPSMPQFLLL